MKYQLQNSKLGKIANLSTLCPYKCKYCYGQKAYKQYPNVRDNLAYNSKMLKSQELPDIPKSRDVVRMYSTLGDFESIEIVDKWYRLAKRSPNKIIYGYTKRWQEKSFLPSLNKLRKLPNVILRASIDSSTGSAPNNWTIAGILESDSTKNLNGKRAYICKFSKNKITCDKCRICFKKNLEDIAVFFPAH